MVHKIPFDIPKPPWTKEEHQPLLHSIGGSCYMNKLNEDLPLLKKSKQRKKSQGKEDKIKIKLQTANQTVMTGNFRYTKINLNG